MIRFGVAGDFFEKNGQNTTICGIMQGMKHPKESRFHSRRVPRKLAIGPGGLGSGLGGGRNDGPTKKKKSAVNSVAKAAVAALGTVNAASADRPPKPSDSAGLPVFGSRRSGGGGAARAAASAAIASVGSRY